MVWIIGLVVLILLVVSAGFRKFAGIFVLIAVIGGVIYWQYQENEEKQRDAVTVTVRYDTKSCSKEFPLFVTIKNGSNKTVEKVSWNIGAYKQGYSNNVVDYGYYSEYSTLYSSDKILNSGQGHAVCYKVPALTGTLEPQNLNWSAVSKGINFEQD